MNTAHDLGGMQNFGPVVPEANEPPFHAEWERRAFGITVAMGSSGLWNLDQSRFARESLAPAAYLASSYYRIWAEGLCTLMLERGLVTAEELADGLPRTPALKILNKLTAAHVGGALVRGHSTLRPETRPARFAVGDSVRTVNIHPRTHTRLPRYCRDKPCTIARIHGPHVFPDANALGRGEDPQWLYSVRFDAHDLWGTDTTAAAVFVDCWEPYLSP